MVKNMTVTISIALCALMALCLSVLPAQAKPRTAPTRSIQEVPLLTHHGERYGLAVVLQGGVPWPAVLDTGADNVQLPWELFDILWQARLLGPKDRLPDGDYRFADGRVVRHMRVHVTLHLGPYQLTQVVAAIGTKGSTLLIGANVLQRFQSFGIDHTRFVLRLGQPR